MDATETIGEMFHSHVMSPSLIQEFLFRKGWNDICFLCHRNWGRVLIEAKYIQLSNEHPKGCQMQFPNYDSVRRIKEPLRQQIENLRFGMKKSRNDVLR
jgi:hypothetical protein